MCDQNILKQQNMQKSKEKKFIIQCNSDLIYNNKYLGKSYQTRTTEKNS